MMLRRNPAVTHASSPRPPGVYKSPGVYFRSSSADAVSCAGSNKNSKGGGGGGEGRRQPVVCMGRSSRLSQPVRSRNNSVNIIGSSPPSPSFPSSRGGRSQLLSQQQQPQQQQRCERQACCLTVCMPNPYTARLSKEKLSLPAKMAVEFLTSTIFPSSLPVHERIPRPLLPPASLAKKTLVLDMDETLIHCSFTRLPDLSVDLRVKLDTEEAYVYFRPFVRSFLQEVAMLFEVLVFTASTQAYADQVMDSLDPDGGLLAHRLYRQHCTYCNGGYVKDLRRLGRPLCRTMLVDNSPISLAFQLDNGIVVSSWLGDSNDTELYHLLSLLQVLSMEHTSVTAYLARAFSLRKWVNSMRVGRHPL